MSPGIATAHSNCGLTLVMEGRPEEALEEIRKERSTGYRSYAMSIAYHALGKSAESDSAPAELANLTSGEWSYQLAATHAYRGETDKAFEALEMAYEGRDAGLPLTRITPMFDSIESDPRWPVFLKKIGLTP